MYNILQKSASYAVDDVALYRYSRNDQWSWWIAYRSRYFLNVTNERTCFASCAGAFESSRLITWLHFWLKSYLCFFDAFEWNRWKLRKDSTSIGNKNYFLKSATSFPGLFPWPSREKPWERGCKIGTFNPSVSANVFHSTSLFWCSPRYHAPTSSVVAFIHSVYKPLTTHNSLIHSDVGLTLETPAFVLPRCRERPQTAKSYLSVWQGNFSVNH